MRRSTIVYVVLFALVFAAAYFFNNRSKTTENVTVTDTVEPVEYLFTPADGLPTRIRIESKAGDIVAVERNAENAWVLTLPDEAAADQGSVEAAAGQVSTMRISEHLPNLAPEAVGLDDPEFTITLGFTSGMERIVAIGVKTPTDSGYYARSEGSDIVIISKSAVDSLLELLTTPPYAATETPVPASP